MVHTVGQEPTDDLIVLIPVYDDWEAVGLLLERLDAALRPVPQRTHVVLIDDGSEVSAHALPLPKLHSIERVSVLALRRNLGHQRALAIGLSYVEAHLPCRALVVMDGDGEDAPADVPRLLERLQKERCRAVVFAERSKRSESLAFRTFYRLYCVLHWLLTGLRVRVGNFSALPPTMLSRLVVVSDLWNHYPASVYKARLPVSLLPTRRAARLAGQSRMNFVGLVTHGLSAISVFGDRVGVRLLVATGGGIALVIVGLVVLLGLRATGFIPAGLIVPGWAATAAGVLVSLLMHMLMLACLFTFTVLGGRGGSSFLPARDYHFFVAELREVYAADERVRLCG
jgi:polyisoprenyl-phosphate glycosyltransferase